MVFRKRPKLQTPTSIKFRVSHPLYGSNVDFAEWKQLCEYTLECAEDKAAAILSMISDAIIASTADEMIATAIQINQYAEGAENVVE